MKYISTEELEKAVLTPSMFDINKDDVIALIAEIPAADVVPRAKVEEIFEDITKAHEYYGRQYDGWTKLRTAISYLKNKYITTKEERVNDNGTK